MKKSEPSKQNNTILGYIKRGEMEFSDERVSIRRYQAECLIAEALGMSRVDLYLNSSYRLNPKEELKVENYFQRRINHEPLQYILGNAHFRELILHVGPGVLIPRPETELLVEKALEKIKPGDTIFDIGTGSGAIGLSVAHETENCRIFGVDISSIALEYSRKNKKINKISNISFIQSNLCSAISDDSANILTANLPYVSQKEYDKLSVDVGMFEPKLALLSGKKGLAHIETLCSQATSVLKKDGHIFLEIGYEQGKAVLSIVESCKSFKNIELLKDYNELDRIIYAQKK